MLICLEVLGATECAFDEASIPTRLSRAQDEGRATEGRLFGFSYAPYTGSIGRHRMAVVAGRDPVVRAMIHEAKNSVNPYQALVSMSQGAPGDAIAQLVAATLRMPREAGLWNDLAVTYLERARVGDDPFDRVLALEACENALAVDSGLLPARFNLALSIEGFARLDITALAWQDYLNRDPSSSWATEARFHLRRLRAERAAAPEGCGRGRFDEVVRDRIPLPSEDFSRPCLDIWRRYIEEDLLAAWAVDRASGRTAIAARRLQWAKGVGQALARNAGDLMVAQAVAAAEDECVRFPPEGSPLFSGLLAYQKGLGLMRRRDMGAAATAFNTAHEMLLRAHNPLAASASFQHAVSRYFSSQYKDAQDELQILARQVSTTRYPILSGRIDSMLGLIRLVEANPATALAYYYRSRLHFEVAHDLEDAAYLDTAIAESLSFIGEERRAWDHRRTALAAAVVLDDSIHVQSIFEEASLAALRRGAPHAARLLQDQALGVARRLADPLATCDALVRRIPEDRSLQDWRALEADRAGADTMVRAIPDPDLRRRAEGDLLVTYAEAQRDARPDVAVGALTRAIDFFTGIGYRFPLVQLLASRAAASQSAGNMASAEADLYAGLRELVRLRDALPDSEQRIHLFEQARTLVDGLLTLVSNHPESPGVGFKYAEMGRARSLLDSVSAQAQTLSAEGKGAARLKLRRPLTLSEVQRHLHRGAILVEYAVLRDRLLRWDVRRKGCTLAILRIQAATLETAVSQLRAGLAISKGRDRTQLQTEARHLYQWLIPAGLVASQHPAELIVVPDRVLAKVPFAALVDPVSGRFLVQQAVIEVAPSASFYIWSASHRSAPPVGLPSALIFGDPTLGPDLASKLPNLPRARSEAARIAEVYPGFRSRLLVGAQATKREFVASAGRFDVVHFAGHAATSGEQPLLFFAGDSSDAGVLSGREIERMRLTRTRLVVLAACSSGLGSETEVEGALSAARAFLTAGVGVVVATLTDIQDDALDSLLRRFHERVARGIDPASALRDVQVEAIGERPHSGALSLDWAALQVMGGILTKADARVGTSGGKTRHRSVHRDRR
jgi:CHAT domain-containing protein